MKRFRPHCAGYIVLYVLVFLSFADVIYTTYRQIRGVQDAMAGFSFFAYIIFAMALCYLWMYARAQVCFDGGKMRMAFPISRAPKDGEARAMFIFRQGATDIRFVDKTLRLDTVTRYGYVEDMGYQPIDESQAGPNNKLFPVHEVAFITSENKRYHMNAAIYSKKQRRAIFDLVRQGSGVEAEGKLGEELRVES